MAHCAGKIGGARRQRLDRNILGTGLKGALFDRGLREKTEAGGAHHQINHLRSRLERTAAGLFGICARRLGGNYAPFAADEHLARIGLAPILGHQRRSGPFNIGRERMEVTTNNVEIISDGKNFAGPEVIFYRRQFGRSHFIERRAGARITHGGVADVERGGGYAEISFVGLNFKSRNDDIRALGGANGIG